MRGYGAPEDKKKKPGLDKVKQKPGTFFRRSPFLTMDRHAWLHTWDTLFFNFLINFVFPDIPDNGRDHIR